MQQGYVRLYRCLLESAWSSQPDFVAVWVYCLLKANYSPTEIITRGGMTVHLNPGQFITSRQHISAQTGVQESKVERILKVFKSEQQIEQENKGKFRLISILNWGKFQCGEQQIEQQMNNKRTANEQQMNTNKKVKKEKKNKEVKKEQEVALLPVCLAWKAYVEHRKKKKAPLTDYASELIAKKLLDFHANGHDPTSVLNLAIERGWVGIFEPKEKGFESVKQQRGLSDDFEKSFLESD